MTPEQLNLVALDAAVALEDTDRFSTEFYDTVFQLAPETRQLFPDDLTDQRTKLVRELTFMVTAATAYESPDQLEAFVERTQALGRRHTGYGVTSEMYEPVAVALVATLRSIVPGFDDTHEDAWTRLLTLIAETMLEGAVNPA